MAQRTIIELLDDLDGETEAAETVSFALDGRSYEIDLSEENASRLREVFAEWTPYARKVGGRTVHRRVPRPRSSTPPSSALREDVSAIREWAKGAGYEVNPRGRIARAVREAFREAMG
jgi:hypothetical protein